MEMRRGMQGVQVIFDGQIDRFGLCSALGINQTEANAMEVRSNQGIEALLLAGYVRFGTDLASKLAGEFALVISDARSGTVYAARDPFGLRPLYLCETSDGIMLAGDVRTCLRVASRSFRIDDEAVIAHLTGTVRSARHTFFTGITRVEPGHFVTIRNGQIRQERYWFPPAVVPVKDPREAVREFRRLFEQAVASRLSGSRPVVIHVSGGLDSSSIACMARQCVDEKTRLRLVGAVFPGMPNDESSYIRSVGEKLRMPIYTWNGAAFENVLVCPSGRISPQRISPVPGDLTIAKRVQAQTLLSGTGADQLLFERGVYCDLLRAGAWQTLVRETLLSPMYSAQPRGFYLKDAVREAFRGWLHPHANSGQSATQSSTWDWLTRPAFYDHIDYLAEEAAMAGVRLHLPFLDTALVKFVLSLPWNVRIPRNGRTKQLLRDALSDVLPEKVLHRRVVTTGGPTIERWFQSARADLRQLFSGKRWESAPWVDRKCVRSQFDALNPHDLKSMLALGRIGLLESWLCSIADGR